MCGQKAFLKIYSELEVRRVICKVKSQYHRKYILLKQLFKKGFWEYINIKLIQYVHFTNQLLRICRIQKLYSTEINV